MCSKLNIPRSSYYKWLNREIPEQEKEYPECNRFRNINAYGIFLRHADNIQIRNVKVEPRKNTLRAYKKIIDCENIKIMKV